MLQADVNPDFAVQKISINRNGSALLLSGSGGLCVMYLYGRTSNKDNATICRYDGKMAIPYDFSLSF